jgi:hypothetical protein
VLEAPSRRCWPARRTLDPASAAADADDDGAVRRQEHRRATADYISGFRAAAAEALDAFGYQQTNVRRDKAGVRYAVLGDFADVELHPDVVSNEVMGYIFEELLRKFSETGNETAGEH